MPSGVRSLKDAVEQMFLGRYLHNIDNKGRLTIPARFRELLAAEGAYITRGFDHNLLVLPDATFQKIYQRVNSLSMTVENARILKRMILTSAEYLEADRIGRILIPQYLRDAAGLDSEAVIAGMGDYFEIWSPVDWEHQDALFNDATANAQRFVALDLSLSTE